MVWLITRISSLTATDYVDVLWLNIPEFLLGEIPINAEYIAYAINYVSRISNNKASVLSPGHNVDL